MANGRRKPAGECRKRWTLNQPAYAGRSPWQFASAVIFTQILLDGKPHLAVLAFAIHLQADLASAELCLLGVENFALAKIEIPQRAGQRTILVMDEDAGLGAGADQLDEFIGTLLRHGFG